MGRMNRSVLRAWELQKLPPGSGRGSGSKSKRGTVSTASVLAGAPRHLPRTTLRGLCSFLTSLKLATFHSLVHSLPSRDFALLPTSTKALSYKPALCSDCGFFLSPPRRAGPPEAPSAAASPVAVWSPQVTLWLDPAVTDTRMPITSAPSDSCSQWLLSHFHFALSSCKSAHSDLSPGGSAPTHSSCDVYFHEWEQLQPLKPKTTGITVDSSLPFDSQLQMPPRSSCLAHGCSLLSTATWAGLGPARLENGDHFLDGLPASSLPLPQSVTHAATRLPFLQRMCRSPRDTHTAEW